jgi:hypothetical protein
MVRLLVVLALVALAGCDPGNLYDGPVVGPDGGVILCQPLEADNGDGHHHSGEDCIVGGCHRGTGGGPEFTVGGTLFDVSRGGAAVGGGTIAIVDGDGKRFTVVSATNGNFYLTQPVTFPLLLNASTCPNMNKMISLSNNGGCNQGGCHSSTDIRVALEGR